MSDERFDKLIKKNLESVRPAYHPQAWNRFRKRLPVSFWSVALPYGGWVLSGLMLAGWLTTLYTLHENQQMITKLGKDLAWSAPSRPLSNTTQPAVTSRIDTVYVVKQTVVEHRHYYSRAGQSSVADKSFMLQPTPRTGDLSAHAEDLQEKSLTPESRTTPLHRSDQSPEIQEVAREALGTESKAVRVLRTKTGRKLPVSTPVNQVIVDKGVKRTRQLPNTPIQPVADSTLATSDAGNKPDSTEVAMANQPEPKQVQRPPHPDSVARKSVIAPALEAQTVQSEKQRRPPFRLSSLQPRLGMEAIATRNGLGAGLALEFFPGENLGLLVGLQASQLHTEKHRGLNDFNSATGKEFADQYRAFLPAQYDRIEDIAIQTSIISLPIHLKYYVPLHQTWSLVFQTGTSLDVAAYQQVRYESFFRNDEQHNSFEANARPTLFHNLMFGTGIQFRQSRISAQLIPYYLYDFRNISDTPSGSNFGLKASLWLNLFK